MKNPLSILRDRLAYWFAAVADSVVGDDPDPQYSALDRMDGLGMVDVVDMPPLEPVREAAPVYDGLVAERLAGERESMPHLHSTRYLAGLVEDGKADRALYEDLLDALCATPDQVWDMFDVQTGSDR